MVLTFNSAVILAQATVSSKNPNMDKLNDGACWTIISTDKSEYCWSDSAFNLVNNVSVTPVPVVKNLEVSCNQYNNAVAKAKSKATLSKFRGHQDDLFIIANELIHYLQFFYLTGTLKQVDCLMPQPVSYINIFI